jgi:uncharacterized membrane protein YccC
MRAVADAARFDRSELAPWAGVVTALPVAAVLAAGLISPDRSAGVLMAVGAMLVGISSRARGNRPRLGTMASATAVIGLSTFVGSATGHIAGLHLGLLTLWSFVGGLMVVIAPERSIVGTLAIIAFIVFGRFTEPVDGAARLAGFVVAGGAAQVIVAFLVRWPHELAIERRAVAAAYRRLAELARSGPERSSLRAAATLDEAAAVIPSARIASRRDLRGLRGLVDEGQRIREELVAIDGLRVEPGLSRTLDQGLAQMGVALDAVAALLEQPGETEVAELGRAVALHLDPPPAKIPADTLRAVGSQVRVAAGLATRASETRLQPGEELRGRLSALQVIEPLRSAAAELRANLTLRSTPCRHAVRLAVLVPATTAVAEYSGLQRGYWVPLTVVLVLRPDFGSTSSQGAARVLGTFLGLALAGVVAASLHPTGSWIVVAVAATSWAAYTTFRASPVAWVGFITALVVFLLNVITSDTTSIVTDRLVDSLIGGAIALGAYLLWPTWSERDAEQSMAHLAEAEREYAGSVLAAHGESPGYHARQARIAASNAEAAVTRSLADPTHRVDADRALGVLEGFRRVSESLHGLRTDLRAGGVTVLVPEAEREADELAAAVDRAMASFVTALRSGRSVDEDSLGVDLGRSQFAREVGERGTLVPIDRLLEALGALAHVLQVDPAAAGSGGS